MRIVRYYPRAITGDGGMTNSVRRWSESMVRAGAEVAIAYEDTGEVPTEWRNIGLQWFPVRHIGPGFLRLPVKQDLQKALRGADVMVLHSAWTPRNNRAGDIARQMGIPYVLEPRGAYDPHIVSRNRWMKGIWLALFERDLIAHARAIHIFFDSERKHLQRLGYAGPVLVAPNGVDTPPHVRWDGGSGEYVLWMGRFDPEHKGLDLILKAVELMPEAERPRVRLHGPRWRDGKEKVAALVESMGLGKLIEVREQVRGAAKFEVMAQAAGFIYPSRWEACSNSVAEALSVGVPTVVTPYPLGEFLAGREAAIMAEPTPAGIAQAMKRLQAPQAREIAENGKNVAHNEITWDAAARSWLTQIQPLL